jgi:hypothetical protein
MIKRVRWAGMPEAKEREIAAREAETRHPLTWNSGWSFILSRHRILFNQKCSLKELLSSFLTSNLGFHPPNQESPDQLVVYFVLVVEIKLSREIPPC